MSLITVELLMRLFQDKSNGSPLDTIITDWFKQHKSPYGQFNSKTNFRALYKLTSGNLSPGGQSPEPMCLA